MSKKVYVKNVPAFPTSPEIGGDDGMTLLDYFAGQALAGTLAAPDCTGEYKVVATECYSQAAAMLKERSKHDIG